MATEAEVRAFYGDTVIPYKVASSVITAALLEHDDVDWGVWVALSSYITQRLLKPEHASMPDGASVSYASVTQMLTVARDAAKARFDERQLFEVSPGKMVVNNLGIDLTEYQAP